LDLATKVGNGRIMRGEKIFLKQSIIVKPFLAVKLSDDEKTPIIVPFQGTVSFLFHLGFVVRKVEDIFQKRNVYVVIHFDGRRIGNELVVLPVDSSKNDKVVKGQEG
jgi:hypothetical protein